MNWYSRIFSPTFLWSLRFIYCIFRGHCSFTVLPPGGVGYLQKFLMWGPDRRVLGRVHCSLLTNLNEEWEHIFVQIVTWSGFDAYRWVARDNLGFIMSQVLRVRKAGFTMVCIPFALQLKDFGKQPFLPNAMRYPKTDQNRDWTVLTQSLPISGYCISSTF
jgi:hypothetical protein